MGYSCYGISAGGLRSPTKRSANARLGRAEVKIPIPEKVNPYGSIDVSDKSGNVAGDSVIATLNECFSIKIGSYSA